jgi:dTDP-D-glucose 4,6-dehydratase
MKLLITGGAGFIGPNLARLAHAAGHEITVVDKLTYAGNMSSLVDLLGQPRFTFIQADICDAEAMRQAFASTKPDAVMHLAAESHVDCSIDGPGEFIATNITGTFTLELVKALCGLLDEFRPRADGKRHDSTITFVTDRPGHDLRYAINASRARAELGWAPRADFQSGLRQTVQWYLENSAWIQAILDGSYRLERQGKL